MIITPYGATDTVTGSRTLVEVGSGSVLVDCGLFQGMKAVRSRNWQAFPVPPASVSAVVLTHAHLDHSGYVPALVDGGFEGPVFCTSGTAALLGLLWPDAAYLQEEDARYRNRHGTTRHAPALPLFTAEQAKRALGKLRTVPFDTPFEPVRGLEARLSPVGHIVGAASLHLAHGPFSAFFSGDVGRSIDPVMRPPDPPPRADVIVIESTYGDRLHGTAPPADELGGIVCRTLGRGGTLLIPAFAVGRSQTLLHLLTELLRSGDIPRAPIFLNSPMAIRATRIFCEHWSDTRLTARQSEQLGEAVTFTSTVEESKELNESRYPSIIISASGMATGGRVLHHLKWMLPDHRNTVLFVGYQAAGTRGEAMLAGVREIKIHGSHHQVRAEVARIDSLSAHADRDELLAWLRRCPGPPKLTLVNHGESHARDAMRQSIEDSLGWRAETAELGGSVDVERLVSGR